MTIGTLASENGVPASTIRYWERIGVLPKPARINGQRRYSADAVEYLAVLRLAQACGFRLDEMRRLLHGFEPSISASQRWKNLAFRKQQEIDEQMARLTAMRLLADRVLQCKCADIRECGRIATSVMEKAPK